MFLLFLCCFLYGQNYTYQNVIHPNSMIQNIDAFPNGDYLLSGTTCSGLSCKGYVERHSNGIPLWSTALHPNGLEIVFTDHVILPNDEIAIVGYMSDIFGTGSEMIVFRLDGMGNKISETFYQGYSYSFIIPHKIIYDPNSNHLFVSGNLGADNPLLNAGMSDSQSFVMSIEMGSMTPNWFQQIDTGLPMGAFDYDCATSMEIVDTDLILVTGAMNHSSNTTSTVMIAALDYTTGTSLYASGIDFGVSARGADLELDDQYNAVVVSNSTDGIIMSCFDPFTGNIQGTPLLDGTILAEPNFELNAYELLDIGNGSATIGGYHNTQAAPGAGSTLQPFYLTYEYANCGFWPALGLLFEASNMLPSAGNTYTNLNAYDQLFTPDMVVDYNSRKFLIGYGNTANPEYTLAGPYFDDEYCAERLDAILDPIGHSTVIQAQTQSVPLSGGDLHNDFQFYGQETFLVCETEFCATSCPVTVNPLCGIEYEISVPDCVPIHLGATYTWTIPQFGTKQGKNFTLSSLGGTFSYTLRIDFFDSAGNPKVCFYQDNFVIPDFNCSDLNITIDVVHDCEDDFILNISPDPGCISTFQILDADLYDSWLNYIFTNETSQSIPFTIGSLGYDRVYFLQLTVQVTDGALNPNVLTCSSPNTIGWFSYWVSFTIDDYCDAEFDATGYSSPYNTFECPLGSNGYSYYEIIPPSPEPCFEYYWDGVLGGISYIDCDATPPTVLIKDTCNCCEYYFESVLDLFGGSNISSNEEFNYSFSESHSTTSVQGLGNEEEVVVFPNPSSDWIKISAGDNAQYKLTLFDKIGKVVVLKETFHSEQSLDVSQLNSGLYLLHLENKATGKRSTQRISVTN